MASEPTHSDDLKARIQSEPDAVVRFFYDTYDVLKSEGKFGDWDSVYHGAAGDLYERLGDWMYPDKGEEGDGRE